jgi:hypothetical protein
VQTGRVDLESVTRELYGLPLSAFTRTRDARASEARDAGNRTLASSLKTLRKPTIGAWLANLVVRERTKDVERLIALGADLRKTGRSLDGEQIRRVSRERNETVTRLVRDARSLAARRGQPVSEPAVLELEATLDAAFADPTSAEELRGGHLTIALQYSGLGLPPRFDVTSATNSDRQAGEKPRPSAAMRRAEIDLEVTSRDAEREDAEVEEARRAVVAAEEDLTRLKAAVALAKQRAKDAHRKAAAAEKSLNALRAGRRRS